MKRVDVGDDQEGWRLEYELNSSTSMRVEIWRFAPGQPDSVDDWEKVGEARLKWDGCLDYTLGDPPIHECGLPLQSVDALLAAIMALGPEIPSWNAEVAGVTRNARAS